MGVPVEREGYRIDPSDWREAWARDAARSLAIDRRFALFLMGATSGKPAEWLACAACGLESAS